MARTMAGNGGVKQSKFNKPKPRGKAVNQAMINAALRTIPRKVLTKPERFAKGAPQSSAAFAARGHGYYDAFVNKAENMVLGSQVGPCTAIEGFARSTVMGTAGVTGLSYALDGTYDGTVTNTVTSNATLIVFNPGSSGSEVACVYQLEPEPTNTARAHVSTQRVHATAFAGLSMPAHNAANEVGVHGGVHDEGAPPLPSALLGLGSLLGGASGSIESIPVRGSIRIRNVTESLAVGGEVRFMRYNGGLRTVDDLVTGGGTGIGEDGVIGPFNSDEGDMSVATFLEIAEMLRDTTRSHTLSGHELTKMHQSNTYPADFIRSHTFRYDDSLAEAVATTKYCTALILIEDFASSNLSGINNTYSITCNIQRAARFKPGSLLHNKAISPKCSQDLHSKASSDEARKTATAPVRNGGGAY